MTEFRIQLIIKLCRLTVIPYTSPEPLRNLRTFCAKKIIQKQNIYKRDFFFLLFES